MINQSLAVYVHVSLPPVHPSSSQTLSHPIFLSQTLQTLMYSSSKSTTARGCLTIKSTVDAYECSPADFFQPFSSLSLSELYSGMQSIIHMIVSFKMRMAEDAQKCPKTNKQKENMKPAQRDDEV